MITLPDGKILNNLPEQVAKNAKDIFEIAQQWDPYKEQLEADFEILAAYLADMSSAAIGAIAGQAIAPDSVSATSITATTITAGKVIAKIDTVNDYEQNIDFPLTADSLDIENRYSKAVYKNNMLLVVANLVVSNNTAGALSFYNVGAASWINVPAEYMDKIYDIDNKTVGEAIVSGRIIACHDANISTTPLFEANDNIPNRYIIRLTNTSSHTGSIGLKIIRSETAYSVPASGKLYITARLWLNL